MLFEEFIMRYIKLNAEPLFILKIEANTISFRINEASKTCLRDLTELLNVLLEDKDGKFVLSLNMIDKCLDFKFLEAEV